MSIGTVGIPLGLTKFVSAWEKEGKWNEIKDTMAKFIIILFSLGVIFLLLTIIFSEQISELLLDSNMYSSFLILTSIAFPFSAVISIFDACLRGLKEFSKYVKISVLTSIMSLVISVLSVLIWGLSGLPASIVIPSVLSLALYIYLFKKNDYFNLRDLLVFNFHISKSLKMILKIGAASLFDLFLHQVTLIIIRSSIIKYLGISSNGIYQVIYVISNNYISLFFVSLWVYVLPVLSQMKEIDEINNELNSTLKFTLFVIFPIIAFTFVFREYVIMILFTSKFLEASDFLIYSFLGDFIRAISWVLSAWLIPRSMLKLWLSLGILFNTIFVSAFYILINYVFLDLRSIVIAYSLANIAHLILTLYISRKVNTFRFRKDVFKLLIITSVCLIVVIISSKIDIVYGYYVLVPVFALWLKICVKKVEALKVLQLVGLGFLNKNK